mmetsp:Transcript_49458/g.88993  ORF Transcript_49458/g.88993 Transcript_49458/m.88993 type:complete len:283 (+) Transcript_49458:235-1083(+)
MIRDLLLCALATQLLVSLLRHGGEAGKQRFQGSLPLGRGSALHIRGGGTLNGTAGGVAQDQDQSGLQSSSAELQAAGDAATGVGDRVPCVSQHEDVARQHIEDELQRDPGVRAAHDGGVRSLAHGGQGLAHLAVKLPSHGAAVAEALVAVLHDLQGHLRIHGFVLGGAHSCVSQCTVHGGRQLGGRRQELLLKRGMPEELHPASLQVVDATLEVHLAAGNGLADRLAELQKEAHSLEDVHLHSVGRNFVGAGTPPKLLRRLARDARQVSQEALQGAAWGGLL